ncbi:MAG: acyltransferase, partial [Pirellulaceae bacterium]|nr:acyltransferase [Pirellulaceae bacterium]
DTTLQSANRPTGKRISELDALRGIAAVAVVLFHYTTRYDDLFGHSQSIPLSVPGGYFGVNLFFMLSGFVILMTLERTSDSWKFAWGRLSRLYPAYWAAALMTFVVVSLFGLPGQEVTVVEALVNTTMIQGMLKVPHIDGAYWSLQAELIFYANMLLLYRAGAFRRPECITIAWVTVAVAVHVATSYAASFYPIVGSVLGKFSTLASLEFIPLFGFGLLCYQWHRDGQSTRLHKLALAICFGSICLMTSTYAAVVDVALASVLAMAVAGRLKVLASRPLVWLGAISYTLYLTHQNIGYVVIQKLESAGFHSIISIAVACAVSVGLASALHYWIERPSMRRLRGMNFPALTRRFRTATANS